MGGEIMWIYIIIAIIVLIVIYALALYNSFVKLNNKVKEAFSTMDVYLKKRWDLIPNIVETVKGYAKHEKDTLKEVVELRNSTYDKMSDEEKINQIRIKNIPSDIFCEATGCKANDFNGWQCDWWGHFQYKGYKFGVCGCAWDGTVGVNLER